MNFITQALGVTCNTCHVRGNFASDEKPEKLTARRMLEMTKGINKQFFPITSRRPANRCSAGSPATPATRANGRPNYLQDTEHASFYGYVNGADMKRALLVCRFSAFGRPPPPRLRRARRRRSCCSSRTPALYKHTSLGPAEKAVTELGKTGGFEVTTVEGYKQDAEAARFLVPHARVPESVRRRDDDDQRQPAVHRRAEEEPARLRPRRQGAIGAHCASLTFYDYPEFGEMLGGYFNRNLPQGTIAVLKVEDSRSTRRRRCSAPAGRSSTSSTCSAPRRGTPARPDENIDVLFKNKIPMGFSRDRVHVLLSLDTEQMDMTKQPNLKRGGDYPQAWTREVRQGPHVLHLARPSRRHLEQRSGVPRAHRRRHSLGARAGAVTTAARGASG